MAASQVQPISVETYQWTVDNRAYPNLTDAQQSLDSPQKVNRALRLSKGIGSEVVAESELMTYEQTAAQIAKTDPEFADAALRWREKCSVRPLNFRQRLGEPVCAIVAPWGVACMRCLMQEPSAGQPDINSMVMGFCDTPEKLRYFLENGHLNFEPASVDSFDVLKGILPPGVKFFEVTADTLIEGHFTTFGAALMSHARWPSNDAMGERWCFSTSADEEMFGKGDAHALILEGMFVHKGVKWFVLHTGHSLQYRFLTTEVMKATRAQIRFIQTAITSYAATLKVESRMTGFVELARDSGVTARSTAEGPARGSPPRELPLATIAVLDCQELSGVGLRDERAPELT